MILPTQEVDSAIAGFEPGSQPPKSAAEILLATLAQVFYDDHYLNGDDFENDDYE